MIISLDAKPNIWLSIPMKVLTNIESIIRPNRLLPTIRFNLHGATRVAW